MGIPQNDLGPRTDVLDGCPKAEGMGMLLRSMSPEILAVDELGGEGDFLAAEQAVFSGTRLLCTLHAGEIRELCSKPYLQPFLKQKVFGRYCRIHREADGTRSLQIYDEHRERIC